MKVAVTGGNGFVGRWLLKALTARAASISILLRRGPAPEGAKVVFGDLLEGKAVEELVEGADVVFHLAGVRRGATRDDFMRVNAEGTRVVADAMVARGAKRLVLCGSLAAAGPSRDGPRVEGAPNEPTEWYGESKAAAEEIALGYSKRLEVAVSKPCRILGPGDVENLTFIKLAARGLVLSLLGPERRLSFVDVDDVVDHLITLGTHPNAPGQAFFCASGETRTVEGFMREVAQWLGVRPRVVRLAPSVLMALGSGADVLTRLTGRKLPLNVKLTRQLLAPGWECSIDKSRRLLGWAPKVTLGASLERTLLALYPSRRAQ